MCVSSRAAYLSSFGYIGGGEMFSLEKGLLQLTNTKNSNFATTFPNITFFDIPMLINNGKYYLNENIPKGLIENGYEAHLNILKEKPFFKGRTSYSN